MRITVGLKGVTCSAIEYLDKGKTGLNKAEIITDMNPHINQQAWGQIIDIVITTEVTQAQTGERCKMITTTTFLVTTDFDILHNLTHELTISILSEFSLIGISHSRAFFIEKSKDTSFSGITIPYKALSEVMKDTRFIIDRMN